MLECHSWRLILLLISLLRSHPRLLGGPPDIMVTLKKREEQTKEKFEHASGTRRLRPSGCAMSSGRGWRSRSSRCGQRCDCRRTEGGGPGGSTRRRSRKTKRPAWRSDEEVACPPTSEEQSRQEGRLMDRGSLCLALRSGVRLRVSPRYTYALCFSLLLRCEGA